MTEWWNTKTLAELTQLEWESLCDGCAKCCLHKLEDEDSGEVFYTKVRCQYLDEVIQVSDLAQLSSKSAFTASSVLPCPASAACKPNNDQPLCG